MKIELCGHDKRYLVETLALLFFPAAGFSREVEDGLSARSTYEDGVACATVEAQGVACSATERSLPGEEASGAIARSFYRAGQALTGITPPWGTLTGIRPAKKVAQLLHRGLTPGQAAERLLQECYTQPEKTALCVEVLAGERAALDRLNPAQVSLYISIPFCPTRCSYCSFVSYTVEREGAFIPAYLEALEQELRQTLSQLSALGIGVQTAYMGGGTPTTLTAAQLRSLFGTLAGQLHVPSLLEFTVEAGRPDTIDADKLQAIREAGANRISVNTQTTDDATLARVGRAHTAEQFFAAYALARSAGIGQINVDLIAGLPEEPVEVFARSMREVAALQPENLTVHALSLKRAARLQYADMDRSRKGSGDIVEMLQTAGRQAAQGGWRPYYLYRQRNTLGNLENVGYAKPGTECLYNTYIMGEYQSIVAVGAGGVSKVVGLPGGKIERVFHNKHVRDYIKDDEKRQRNIKTLFSLLKNRYT
ncbi:MAG: coproporphyrinogen dehydrogenase HemZ [Clostridiales bacterium]|nr:coproporphyrinogen dehydrogenase HemZ [Clostridiales bacterium]